MRDKHERKHRRTWKNPESVAFMAAADFSAPGMNLAEAMGLGATDGEACPTRRPRGGCRCKPRCAVCGYGEHDAIHGPKFGEPPGSEPWGHQFEPSDNSSPATDT